MEEKVYAVQGTVTISIEEYKDLVRGLAESEKEASDYRSKYWSMQTERDRYKEKVEAQEKAIASYREFVMYSKEVNDAYKEFLLSKQIED